MGDAFDFILEYIDTIEITNVSLCGNKPTYSTDDLRELIVNLKNRWEEIQSDKG